MTHLDEELLTLPTVSAVAQGIGAEAQDIALFALEQVCGRRESTRADGIRAEEWLRERADILEQVCAFGVRRGPSDRWREAADACGDLAPEVGKARAYLLYAVAETPLAE